MTKKYNKKYTKDYFVEKSIEYHSNKYDYSKFNFINMSVESIIICPIHGEFLQTPKDHLRTKGCRKCSGKTKLTNEEFIEKANKVHNNKYDYSKSVYINKKTKVSIICPIHGEFLQTPDDHCNKPAGCPKCKIDKLIIRNSYTLEDFLDLANRQFGTKFEYLKDTYNTYSELMSIICPIHGEFKQSPSNHLGALEGCPTCGRERANESESDTLEIFIKKAKNTHKDRYDYSKVNYIKSLTKVIIICKEHGEFEQTPSNHIVGQNCPKCNLKSQTQLYEKLKESFPNIEILFEVGKNQVYWLEKQRFDIYIPKYNIAIEYNGQQHYYPIEYFGGEEGFIQTKERDSLKRQKCKDNNCILFEVKYDYTENDYLKLVNDINNIITLDKTGLLEAIE